MRRVVAAALGIGLLSSIALAAGPGPTSMNPNALTVFRVFGGGDDDSTDGGTIARRPVKKQRKAKPRKARRARVAATPEAQTENPTGILGLIDPCSPVQ